jgi:hypothetical protein
MAKYKMGNSAILSGRVGGIVYKNGPNGPYLQKYTKKKNTKTTIISARGNVTIDPAKPKQVLATLSSHWRTLNGVEQFSFDVQSYFYPPIVWGGTSRRRTAKSLFTHLNAPLMLYCGVDLTGINYTCPPPAFTSPVQTMLNPVCITSIAQMTATIVFSNGTRIVPPDCVLVLSGTEPWTANYPFMPSQFSHIYQTYPPNTDMDLVNLYPDYVSSFNNLNPGDRIILGAFTVNLITGQRTKPKYLRFFVS